MKKRSMMEWLRIIEDRAFKLIRAYRKHGKEIDSELARLDDAVTGFDEEKKLHDARMAAYYAKRNAALLGARRRKQRQKGAVHDQGGKKG